MARKEITNQSSSEEKAIAAEELKLARAELAQWYRNAYADPTRERVVQEWGADLGPKISFREYVNAATQISRKYDYVDFGNRAGFSESISAGGLKVGAPSELTFGGEEPRPADFYIAGPSDTRLWSVTEKSEVVDLTTLQSYETTGTKIVNDFTNFGGEFYDINDFNAWQQAGKPDGWVAGQGLPTQQSPRVTEISQGELPAELTIESFNNTRLGNDPNDLSVVTTTSIDGNNFEQDPNSVTTTQRQARPRSFSDAAQIAARDNAQDNVQNDTNNVTLDPRPMSLAGAVTPNPLDRNVAGNPMQFATLDDDAGKVYPNTPPPGTNIDSGADAGYDSTSTQERIDDPESDGMPLYRDQKFDEQTSDIDVTQVDNIQRSDKDDQIGSYENNNPQIGLRPNVLHDFANWSYNLSLYMLTPLLHKSITQNGRITNPGVELRHLLIKSGGTGGKGVLGQNKDYHMENLRFLSIISQNSLTAKASNNFNISFEIVEPYGVAFMSELVQYAGSIGLPDHFEVPYLIQIKFNGFDSNGNAYTDVTPPKYIPIKIINIQFKVNSGATIYTVTAVPFAHSPLQDQHTSYIQENISVTGNTFEELISNLFAHMNKSEEAKALQQNREKDEFSFEIYDTDLKQSQVGYNKDKQRAIEAARKSLDAAGELKEIVQIPSGSTLKSAIQKLAQATDFGARFNTTGAPESEPGNENRPMRLLKVIPLIEELGKYNTSTKRYTKKLFFKIDTEKQYGYVAAGMPQGKPTLRGWQKEYEWIFTGQNKDIVDFDAEYNLQYFIKRTAFTEEHGKVLGTPSGNTEPIALPDDNLRLIQQGASLFSPAVFATTGNDSDNVSNNARSYGHQLANDNMDNILNNPGADMIVLKLNIVGDPDWIPQDRSVLPRGTSSSGNSYMINGSLAVDNHDVFVNLKFKTPRDYNNKTGVMDLSTNNNSFIQGLYRVISIENVFEGGKFSQELTMYRAQKQVGNNFGFGNSPLGEFGGLTSVTSIIENLLGDI